MTRLDDRQNTGLPPPPAPPKRSANPWRLSDTARKSERRPESVSPDLLAELIKSAHAADAHAEDERPPPAPAARPRPGLMSLVIVGFAVVMVIRIFFSAREGGGWVRYIGPLLVIAFIAHGWWRIRQRSEAKKSRLE